MEPATLCQNAWRWQMNEVKITENTVRLIRRILRPIAEEGVIPLPEYNEVVSHLTSLAEHGTLKPVILPKLIDQKEAAEMLGISHSNFKKLEAEGAFPFPRKLVGSAVRYRNTEVMDYILSSDKGA